MYRRSFDENETLQGETSRYFADCQADIVSTLVRNRVPPVRRIGPSRGM